MIEKVLKSGNACIIDVRTVSEFMGGHVVGSKNLPLNELENNFTELHGVKDIVLCCASGGRSAYAKAFLQAQGIDCYDGGSWMTVNRILNQ